VQRPPNFSAASKMTSGRICRKLSSIAFILDERTLLNKWALGNRQQATGGNSSSNPPALRAAYAGSGLKVQGFFKGLRFLKESSFNTFKPFNRCAPFKTSSEPKRDRLKI
jgi:hypothetical protein